MTQGHDDAEAAFFEALGRLGPALLQAMAAMEEARRRLHPPAIRGLRQALGPVRDRLDEARERFEEGPAPAGLTELGEQLGRAAEHSADALRLFTDSASPERSVPQLLEAMRRSSLAQETLFPLRKALPPLNHFFLEPDFRDRLDELDPESPARDDVGLFHAKGGEEERGGFSLYVPESCSADEPLPMIVALHGGSGHGREFLWSWLREARGRRCLLLSPSSRGSTWSLNGPDQDADNLRAMIDHVAERWPLDRTRILLTGLSDGATYTFLCGLGEDTPYSALAPVSGVLHPANFANGNLARARGRRIYLVHGALDWMFPVGLARMAREELEKAGAELVYREIEDLSHTYPREENARILDWWLQP